MITTKEDAEKELDTCVYNVQGLVDDADPKSVKALIDVICECVATDTWAVNGGGQAEIRPLPSGLLVVSQTPADSRGSERPAEQDPQDAREGAAYQSWPTRLRAATKPLIAQVIADQQRQRRRQNHRHWRRIYWRRIFLNSVNRPSERRGSSPPG